MLKLLVADDERIYGRRYAISSIEKHRHRAGGSCKMREAFEEACRSRPDIFLTDIKLPAFPGLTLLKSSRSRPGVEFSCDGLWDFDYAHAPLSPRVHHYLLKPCNEQQIIVAVRRRHSPSTRAASSSKWSRPVRCGAP
jgi:YesN/AraC family two-component response regulator